MYASHGLDKKINLQNMQNMKNHVVSGLTQKPQKNKLDNVFFWQNMQNKKTMKSSALTENHTRHKKDTLDPKKCVAEHAEHRKPRNFVQHRIHTRHKRRQT
jgi:hypothetical protein